MLLFQAGSLHLSDQCLCDNRNDGLSVGPYCPNDDCHWAIADKGECRRSSGCCSACPVAEGVQSYDCTCLSWKPLHAA